MILFGKKIVWLFWISLPMVIIRKLYRKVWVSGKSGLSFHLCALNLLNCIIVSQLYLLSFLYVYPHRDSKDLRCIVFVERVITAITLCRLLDVLLPSLSGWKTKYIAGSNTLVQLQSRKTQNEIIEELRKGAVLIMCYAYVDIILFEEQYMLT